MGPDGQESSGSKTILSRQRCSWMSQLYITTRVFTYFHTSLAIIKWWPSGHLLIFCIWPLKPKCLSAMSRPCRLQQCATCHVERDGQMPNGNKKKNDNWKLVSRESRGGVKTAVPDLHGAHFHHSLVCQTASPRRGPPSIWTARP